MNSSDAAKIRSLVRLPVLVARVVAVFGSLLTFPEYMPVVTGIWLLVFTIQFLRKRFSWPALAMLPGLILIKWPEPGLMLALLTSTATVLLVMHFRRADRQTQMPNYTCALTNAIWIFWSGYLLVHITGSTTTTRTTAIAERPVVCLGDSLTDCGYPQILKTLIALPVQDFGFDGYKTDDGIDLLPQIIALNPQCVIIELGGHDYKDGQPRSRTRKNLEQIIQTLLAADSQVVIVEIPRGFISDPYFGLERQLARKYDLQLIPDTMIRRLIFWSPIVPPGQWVDPSVHNSDDGLHPNENGNRVMAGYVLDALTKIYSESIRR